MTQPGAQDHRAAERRPSASALHPQTILCLTYAGRPIEPKFGAPMRLKMTTKLGFKQPKFTTSIHVTNDYSGGSLSRRQRVAWRFETLFRGRATWHKGAATFSGPVRT